MLIAIEQTRFLKLVLYFWHLQKISSRESAKDLLVDTLHALALHQLLITRGMTTLQVRFHSSTLSFSSYFRRLLQDLEASSSGGNVDGLLDLIETRVRLEMNEEDDFLIEWAARESQKAVENLLARERREIVEFRGFSNQILEGENAEQIADTILDAGEATF